jgi:hypothetical protein
MKLKLNQHNCNPDRYKSNQIQNLIINKQSRINTHFKEITYDDNEEYLKRFYKIEEAYERLPKIANYYRNYSKFFCRPVFSDHNVNLLLESNGDHKAENYYKINYMKKTDQNIEPTLFTTTIKEHIEENIRSNSVSMLDNISIINKSGLLTTKRSKNPSLLCIIYELSKKKDESKTVSTFDKTHSIKNEEDKLLKLNFKAMENKSRNKKTLENDNLRTSNTNKSAVRGTTVYPMIKNFKTEMSVKKDNITRTTMTKSFKTQSIIKNQKIPKLEMNEFIKLNLFPSVDKYSQYYKKIFNSRNIASTIKFTVKNIVVNKAVHNNPVKKKETSVEKKIFNTYTTSKPILNITKTSLKLTPKITSTKIVKK